MKVPAPEAPADLLAPPPVTLEVAYRPAMVLSQATSRWDLDRYVLVAPLLDYHVSEVAEDKWPAIRTAQKIGYFPVLPLPNAPPPVPTFVHLSRVTTVERRLLAFARTLASLTPAAVHLLRIKLAETLSVPAAPLRTPPPHPPAPAEGVPFSAPD